MSTSTCHMYLGNILLLRSCFVFFTHHKMHFSDVRCTQGTKRRDEYAFFSNVFSRHDKQLSVFVLRPNSRTATQTTSSKWHEFLWSVLNLWKALVQPWKICNPAIQHVVVFLAFAVFQFWCKIFFLFSRLSSTVFVHKRALQMHVSVAVTPCYHVVVHSLEKVGVSGHLLGISCLPKSLLLMGTTIRRRGNSFYEKSELFILSLLLWQK